MKTILSIVFSFLILLNPTNTLGNDAPSLLSPSNNSTASSSKLTWQNPSYALYSSKPFRVQIDNNQDFTSIEKDYQTGNTYYSPSIEKGTWYWRVKVKSADNTWSDWTSPWSFILSEADTSENTESSPGSDNNSSQTKFTISSTPSQINSDQEIEVEVEVESPKNPGTNFYIKGAFAKDSSTNYFGQTKVSDSWVKNNSTFSEQLKITTDSSGKWSGKVKVMSDSEDSGFTGSGDYIFKVGKYTSSGSGLTWSNQSNIKINDVTPAETPAPTKASTTPTSSPTKTSSPSAIPKSSIASLVSSSEATLTPEVAGIATTSSEQIPLTKDEKNINWWAISGGILLLFTSAGFVVKFIHDKKRAGSYS